MRYAARLFIVTFAFVLIIGVAAPALSVSLTSKISELTAGSPTDWSASVLASITGTSDPATFGVRIDATSFFDLAYDSPEPPTPPTTMYIQAYTYYSANPTGYKMLDKSYIAPGDNLIWDPLRIKYVNDDDPDTPMEITLTWDISDIPADYGVCLYEATTLLADMRAVSSYKFWTIPATKAFKIVVIRTQDTIPPEAPILISPENCNDILDNTPTFMWTVVTDPSGVTYQIQIDDTVDLIVPDFFFPVYYLENIPINTYTLPDENALQICVHYFWRVRAKDGAGNIGPWSEPWHFHVVPIGAVGVLLMPLLFLLPFLLIVRRQNRRYHY